MRIEKNYKEEFIGARDMLFKAEMIILDYQDGEHCLDGCQPEDDWFCLVCRCKSWLEEFIERGRM